MISEIERLQYYDEPTYYETEAIEFLRNKAPIAALEWSDDLAAVCKVHTDDQIRNRFFDHDSSDGSSFWERAAKYGQGYVYSENLAWGAQSALENVVMWLTSPAHRDNIFSETPLLMGAYTGFSDEYRDITTQLFAVDYRLFGNQAEAPDNVDELLD